MKNILILLSIVFTIVVVSCNDDEPYSPDCEGLYPAYGSTIAEYEPTFKWCPIKNRESYRFQLSDDEGFGNILFDTIAASNLITPLYLVPDPNMANNYFYAKLDWGTTYYWRIAGIKNDIEKDWSDTYTFETYDIRDDIIGTYEAQKTKFYIRAHFWTSYLDSIHSVHEIVVEKVPNSRGLRIKDASFGDFDVELHKSFFNNYEWHKSDAKANAKFKIDVDSFSIKHIPCYAPCAGYLYSGRK